MSENDPMSDENADKGASDGESGSASDDRPQPSATKEDPPPTAVVWCVRFVTAALMAAIVGYLLYLVMRDEIPVAFDIAPDFSAMRQNSEGCALPIDLTNVSTQAVGAITLTAENQPSTDTPEVLTTTFSLMGQGETVTSELVFGECPTESSLDLRVTSYQSP